MDMRRMSIVCSERFMIDPVNEKSPGDTCRRALLFSTCFTWLQAAANHHDSIVAANRSVCVCGCQDPATGRTGKSAQPAM